MRRAMATMTDNFSTQQWQRYLGLCGRWQGSWTRFSVGHDGKLVPAIPFRAVCAPMIDEDRCSVRHMNYYEKGTAPAGGKPTGQEIDGLVEIDFGSFNQESFRHPFGPTSLALYLDECGVAAASQVTSWPPKMFAVELMTICPKLRRRRRLVCVWKPADQEGSESSSILQLASVTAVAEDEGQPSSESLEAPLEVAAVLAAQRVAANAVDGTEVSDEKIADWAPGGLWQAIPGVPDIAARLPLQLTQEMLLSRQLAVGLAWRRSKDDFLRVGVAYDEAGQLAQFVREALNIE